MIKRMVNRIIFNFISAGYIFTLSKYKKNYFSLSIENKKNIFLKNLTENNLNNSFINDNFCKFL